jgi:hypothetical protein
MAPSRHGLFLNRFSLQRRRVATQTGHRAAVDGWVALGLHDQGTVPPSGRFHSADQTGKLRRLSDLLNKCHPGSVNRSNDRLTEGFMKKFLLLLLAAVGLIALTPQPAKADVDFGITFGGPGYYDPYPVYYGPYYGDRYYYYHHHRPYYYDHPYHYGYWHRYHYWRRDHYWHRRWHHHDWD